jgi:hypothetical protein
MRGDMKKLIWKLRYTRYAHRQTSFKWSLC